jgi:hypothetical protein
MGNAAADKERPIARGQWVQAAIYCIALLWINLYISRGLFTTHVAPMYSMQGLWAGLARLADGSWWRPTWWPYWDCGMPFEFTYAPMVPALTALGSSLFHAPRNLVFQGITAITYSLAPVAVFVLAWVFTRAAGYSFLAGVFYSLTSVTRILTPDDSRFSWHSLFDMRRLYIMGDWDETPHVLSLVMVMLAVVFLALSIRDRRRAYYVITAMLIGMAALTSVFAPIVMMMAALCLLFVLRREDLAGNIALVVAIGAYGYALSARFLPPSLIRAIHTASKRGEAANWSMGTLTALSLIVLGWILLWHFLPRWTSDWRMQFFALFTYLVSCPPVLTRWLDRNILPQPGRYKLEMEMAWAILLIFVARYWIEKLPRKFKWALLFVYVSLAGEQIAQDRVWAKASFQAEPYETTIEYRVSTWLARNLPGVRVYLPGTIARWAEAFADVPQYGGESWSIAYNAVQQTGDDGIANGGHTQEEDAVIGLAWLRAYGVGAVCVPGAKSPEFWKGIVHPAKFDGVLPLLWREDDTSIYSVPQHSASLAHVVPAAAIVRRAPRSRGEIGEIQRYDAALEDASLPAADFRWEGRNGIGIHTSARPGQVISVQVSYHPGWHVTVGNRHPKLHKDGLGLMWFDPECNGACDASLDYDGGWELRIFRWLSYLAFCGLLVGAVVRGVSGRMSRGGPAPLVGRGVPVADS